MGRTNIFVVDYPPVIKHGNGNQWKIHYIYICDFPVEKPIPSGYYQRWTMLFDYALSSQNQVSPAAEKLARRAVTNGEV